MPIPLVIRVLAAAKEAKDWFSFANEAISALGLVKRTAVVGAGAAAVVVGGAAVTSHAPVQQVQSPVAQAIEVHAPEITPEIREQVLKAREQLYSKLFLQEPKNAALLQAIIAVCQDERALPVQQCEIADMAQKYLAAKERDEKRNAARAKIAAEQKPVGHVSLPYEHQLVK